MEPDFFFLLRDWDHSLLSSFFFFFWLYPEPGNLKIPALPPCLFNCRYLNFCSSITFNWTAWLFVTFNINILKQYFLKWIIVKKCPQTLRKTINRSCIVIYIYSLGDAAKRGLWTRRPDFPKIVEYFQAVSRYFLLPCCVRYKGKALGYCCCWIRWMTYHRPL